MMGCTNSCSLRRVLISALAFVGAGHASQTLAADVAWVARINGAPMITRAGKTDPLKVGDTVQVGNVIETNDSSKVKILLGDDSLLDVGPKSRVSLDEFLIHSQGRKVRLQVAVGRFKLAVPKFFGGGTDYEVRTPTALAGVRGTVLWGDTDLDAICSLEGTIEVRSLKATGLPARLAAGACVHQMAEGKAAPFKPSAADLAGYLKMVTPE